jgi:16S rRNA (uracil1498-N3)-methyltransferase
MQYLYHQEAGAVGITLDGDAHRYIFKVRRHQVGDFINLRNLSDGVLYTYTIVTIDKRSVSLALKEKRTLEVKASRELHIGWCVIDPKQIEKVLPTLNELGVAKVTFIYCSRSQKQFKIDLNRLEKIVRNSSQQCGRSVMMTFDVMASLEQFLEHYPEAKMVHFSSHTLETKSEGKTFIIGCEGGFSPAEVALFEVQNIVGFKTELILKSESAVCALASKLLV